MGRKLGFGWLVLASVLVFACSTSVREGYDDPTRLGDNGDGTGNGPGSLGPTAPTDPPAESKECEKMDILFVVDDSGSMAEEQTNLATNFPKFFEKIETFETKSGSKLDWRIAVTTTGRDVNYSIDLSIPGLPTPLPPQTLKEKGDNGAFRMPKDCGTTKRWIEKSDPNAASAFSCLAKVGTKGPALEMPLYTTKLALNDRVADGTNAGFRRDDALLAVVILTDEDDCSREDDNFTIQSDSCVGSTDVKPVNDYKQMLDTVSKGAGRWATAVIAGPSACQSAFGEAGEAKRLKEFVDLAGKNGTFSSICAGDLSSALVTALDTFDAACKAFPPSEVK